MALTAFFARADMEWFLLEDAELAPVESTEERGVLVLLRWFCSAVAIYAAAAGYMFAVVEEGVVGVGGCVLWGEAC